MVSKPHAEALPIDPNDGVIRIGGTRVTLDTVVNAFNKGMSAEEIAIAYSAISLADVYDTIAYYLRHHQEVNEYMSRREQRAEKVRQEVEARHPDMVGIRERLQARLDTKNQKIVALRFATDENFDNRILRGLLRLKPDLDIIRVQDTELIGVPDPELLEWLAKEERILLTHDVETMVGFAYERVANGVTMPGVFEIRDSVPLGIALRELTLIVEASDPDEWKDKVTYIPLR